MSRLTALSTMYCSGHKAHAASTHFCFRPNVTQKPDPLQQYSCQIPLGQHRGRDFRTSRRSNNVLSPEPQCPDGFLSNEDFRRIKELKAKKEAKAALAQHGSKVSSFDQLSAKPFDPSKLVAHVRRKMSKVERLAMVREGREDREKFQARTAMRQHKTGGLSNRQMPLRARISKITKSRQDKKKKQQSRKQFRGKKAWKN